MTDAGEGNEIGRGALRACLGGFAVPEGAEEHTPPAGAPVRCGPPRRAGPRDWPVVGARRATPYGRGCAKRFAAAAAERGVAIISGGARGCDAVAPRRRPWPRARPRWPSSGAAATQLYPAENAGLFQRIVAAGGAVVSEHEWDFPPQPHTFRARNRLIAGLSRATLIVEAGLPSGTFSTADEALLAGREVWVVPGAITSAASKGANRLLYQGALPIVDDEAFADALFSTFGCLKEQRAEAADDRGKASQPYRGEEALLAALQAEPLGMEALRQLARGHAPAGDTFTWLMIWLAEAQRDGLIAQYPDGRYGPHPALRTAV